MTGFELTFFRVWEGRRDVVGGKEEDDDEEDRNFTWTEKLDKITKYIDGYVIYIGVLCPCLYL